MWLWNRNELMISQLMPATLWKSYRFAKFGELSKFFLLIHHILNKNHLVLLLLTHNTFEILVLVLNSKSALNLFFYITFVQIIEGVVAKLTSLLPPLLIFLYIFLHFLHLLSKVFSNLHLSVIVCRLLLLSLFF